MNLNAHIVTDTEAETWFVEYGPDFGSIVGPFNLIETRITAIDAGNGLFLVTGPEAPRVGTLRPNMVFDLSHRMLQGVPVTVREMAEDEIDTFYPNDDEEDEDEDDEDDIEVLDDPDDADDESDDPPES